jgi:hypothetical protein
MQCCLRVSLVVDHVSHNLCQKYGVDVSVRPVVVQARFEFTDLRHSFRPSFLFQANRLLPRRRPKQAIFSCFGQHRPPTWTTFLLPPAHRLHSTRRPPETRRQLLHAARCRSR